MQEPWLSLILNSQYLQSFGPRFPLVQRRPTTGRRRLFSATTLIALALSLAFPLGFVSSCEGARSPGSVGSDLNTSARSVAPRDPGGPGDFSRPSGSEDLGDPGDPGGLRGTTQTAGGSVLERLRQELVPADNASTSYGVRFSVEGYQTLLLWHSQYRVSEAQSTAFASLNLTLPCCAFGHPSADETKNCGCGHHQALYGLSKRLLGLGYSQTAVQEQVDRWKAYFFPRESLEAALSQRAGSDPAIQQALDELRQNGGC